MKQTHSLLPKTSDNRTIIDRDLQDLETYLTQQTQTISPAPLVQPEATPSKQIRN